MLAGTMITAFCALAVVGIATGIWVVGRGNGGSSQAEAAGQENAGHLHGAGPGASALTEEEIELMEIGMKLEYIEALIDKYYLFDEESEREDPIDWMYMGYVYSLQDPYSVYYTAEDYESLMQSVEGEYCGIGVMVSQNIYTGLVTVVKVFPGAPADVGGMLPGDVITAVEGIDIGGMDLSLVVSDHIKGEEGTDVVVTVYRAETDEYVDLTMTRAIVQNPTVEHQMLDGGIGYIILSSFEDVSAEQFKTAYDELEEQGMEGLILDLRNNGGGTVQAAEAIADYLLPDGLNVVSFSGKGVEDSTYVSRDGHEAEVPMVVLVNEQSASASEVLTGALNDHDCATVVGTRTFGKGIAQGIFPLHDGSALKLTTAYYYVPSGKCIHEEGIEPDIEVELDEEQKSKVVVELEDDNQLQIARQVLLEGEDAVKARVEEEQAGEEAAD